MTFRNATRGQIQQDFIIGATIFFIAVSFTVTFVPNIATPFQDDIGEEGNELKATTVADLTRNRILTTENREPGTVTRTCVEGYFQEEGTRGCPVYGSQFDTSLTVIYGLEDTTHVRIEMINTSTGNVGTLNIRNQSYTVVDTVTLKRGSDLPQNTEVSTETRAVWLDGKEYLLKIYLW